MASPRQTTLAPIFKAACSPRTSSEHCSRCWMQHPRCASTRLRNARSVVSTYRAMQVGQGRRLELVEREVPAPGTGQVLIEVEACGICGADAADIDRADP